MKILIAAGPRTGSHAFCEIQPVKNNLSEIMNIEDMLLPRLDDGTIDFSICSDEFIREIENHNWKLAWEYRPLSFDPSKHHLLTFTEQLEKIRITTYPNQYELLFEQRKRWTNIQQLEDWCIKVIKYQDIPTFILNEIIEDADTVYLLDRKDKVAQALSMTKATQTQLWHGTVDNPIITYGGNIDYRTFSTCCRTIRSEDIWLEETFGSLPNVRKVYYEDIDLSNSNYVKNDIKMTYDINQCQLYWDSSEKTMREWFKEFIDNYDWSSLYELRPSDGYFRMCTDSSMENLEYWDLHLAALETIDIDNMPRDIAWLDIGIWFGLLAFIMKNRGFTNIETTDCAVHRIGNDEYFGKLWEHFGLNPRELHILPKVKFDLGKKYDLITITKSNVFWKTEEVIHWDGQNMGVAWQNQGDDGKSHTYFSVYNKEEWEFFIENIKEFLNPGGVAIINPEPWVYDKIPSCHPARDYLKQFQNNIIPTGNPYSNYLIVRK